MATLKKTQAGGYESPDGRWLVEPVIMGAGQAGGRWSNGSKEWQLTDVFGQAVLSKYGNPHSHIYNALWRVRDAIDYHEGGG